VVSNLPPSLIFRKAGRGSFKLEQLVSVDVHGNDHIVGEGEFFQDAPKVPRETEDCSAAEHQMESITSMGLFQWSGRGFTEISVRWELFFESAVEGLCGKFCTLFVGGPNDD